MIYSSMDVSNDNSLISEVVELRNKLSSSMAPVELKESAMRSIQRLERIAKWGNYSSEFESVDKYVDWVTRIPWGVLSKDNLDISNARKLMDSTHYGMDMVKEMILDFLAAMQLKGMASERGVLATRNESPSLLFLGLQGIGKTSIAQSIAQAMGRKFARISLGAVGDVRTLRGIPRHEMDSEPGQIVKALVRTGTMNPVILIDEIEKSSQNVGIHNDIMAALLEILDPEQNATFVDHYIDHPIDLSNVFFICTANNLGGLSAALLDRLEVIRFTSYSDEDKEEIAKSYILPKVFSSMGLSSEYIQISQDVWPLLIRPVGFDAGIRQLERNIATLARSAAREIVSGKSIPIVVTPENLKHYLLPDQVL